MCVSASYPSISTTILSHTVLEGVQGNIHKLLSSITPTLNHMTNRYILSSDDEIG